MSRKKGVTCFSMLPIIGFYVTATILRHDFRIFGKGRGGGAKRIQIGYQLAKFPPFLILFNKSTSIISNIYRLGGTVPKCVTKTTKVTFVYFILNDKNIPGLKYVLQSLNWFNLFPSRIVFLENSTRGHKESVLN